MPCCKFCGSERLQTEQLSRQLSKTNNVGVNIDALRILGATITNQTEKTIEFVSDELSCRTCLNSDIFTDKEPVVFDTQDVQKPSLSIPPMLLWSCHTYGISLDNIRASISSIFNTFENFLRDYVTNGSNPCHNNRVGKRISLFFHQFGEIMCYLLVEDINGKYIFRIVYGGKDIICL